LATQQVHIRGGKIHKHGPQHDPCPRSNKPPLQASSQTPTPTDHSVSNSSANFPNAVLSEMPLSHCPSGCQRILQLSNIYRNRLDLPVPPIWRQCCVKLFPTRTQLLSGWIWGDTVLHAPKRGGKRHNLASAIKHRIASYSVGQPDSDSANPTHNAQRQLSSTSIISQAVSAKLEDGNVRAAIRLLMSEDSPAAPLPHSLSALREKHPPSSSVLTDLPAPQPQHCLSMDESEVRKAVLLFPAGSAGGPDGLVLSTFVTC